MKRVGLFVILWGLLMPLSHAAQLTYTDIGSGKPILLIHGFGAAQATWDNLTPALARDHRVIRVDLKGFGESPKPDDDHYTPNDQVDAVVQLIHELDLKELTLFGHSYGGGVALLTFDRLQNEKRIEKLVLIDAAAYPQRLPYFIGVLRVPLLGALLQSVVPLELQVRSTLKMCYYDHSKITDDLVRAYAAPLRTKAGRVAVRKVANMIFPQDIDALLKRFKAVDVPTLILWGEHDRVIPIEHGRRLHHDIPNSRFEVIAQSGHNPHEESAARVLEVLTAFL